VLWSFVEMERYRIAAVELFITTESVTVTLPGFRQQFQRHDASGRIVGIEMASRRITEGQ